MGLVQHVQKNAVTWRLRPDNKVVVKGEWEAPPQRLDAAEMILKALSALAVQSHQAA
jgi:transcription-repair coupling factor (superfamily II helicase)